MLATTGVRRLRVEKWLPEEPYPRAEIELLDDDVPRSSATEQRTAVERLLGRVFGLRAELGDPGPPVDVQLDDDPVRASFEAAARAPLGPLDAQQLLELDSPVARFEALAALLEEEARYLELRLSGS